MSPLLVLSSRWPLPAISGEKKRTLAVLKELSALCPVTFVSLADPETSESDRRKLQELCGCAEVVMIPHGRRSKLWGLIGAIFSARPLQAGYFFSPRMNRWVRANGSRFPFVYCLLARTAEAGLLAPGRKILDLCDLISLNYEGAGRRSRGLRRWAYLFEGSRMRRFETRMAGLFERVFLVNPGEVEKCRACGLMRVEHLPLGIQEPRVQPGATVAQTGRVGFLGKMDYAPNVDAVQWFTSMVMPLLPRSFGFRIIGSSPSPAVQALASSERVQVTGFVEDVAPEVQSCEWMVAPLRFGAGVQNKVIEAWLFGRPVLMSPAVAEGLGCEPETVAPFLAESPRDYADKILGGQRHEDLLSQLKNQTLACHGVDKLRAKLAEALAPL